MTRSSIKEGPVSLPVYDRSKSYRWNYDHAPLEDIGWPARERLQIPSLDFFGLPVASRLGVAAGPLLNGRWVLYYAQRGFDVLTYKTVRSHQRDCYPLPNLVPVDDSSIDSGVKLQAQERMQSSWAISFGMPSMPPDVWRADVEWTRRRLAAGQLLCVSVVATPEPDWTLEDVADDYAQCAAWAVESGADCIEVNFSCPNVSSCDGQLYQQPHVAKRVAATIRSRIGSTPLIAKIGHVRQESDARALVAALDGIVDGLSMTNCLTATLEADGATLFGGQPRGIGGAAIREASITQVALFRQCITAQSAAIRIVGVGGVFSADHVQAYLDAGAHAVHLATAIMLDPQIGFKIQSQSNELRS